MKSVGSVKSSFFVRKAIDHTAAFTIDRYPLKNSAILDSGTTIHIFNEISRFTNFRTADPRDFVWAGTERVPIQGYGNVDIEVTVPGKKHHSTIIPRLHDFARSLATSRTLGSLRLLRI